MKAKGNPSLWMPTLLLGGAMVARGKIGLVILMAALSSGAVPDDLLLIAVWCVASPTNVPAVSDVAQAVLLNLAGPTIVGLLSKQTRSGSVVVARSDGLEARLFCALGGTRALGTYRHRAPSLRVRLRPARQGATLASTRCQKLSDQ